MEADVADGNPGAPGATLLGTRASCTGWSQPASITETAN